MAHEVEVPLDVRLRFGRAAVQVVADGIGADILHIKGDAVDAALRESDPGSDVDILVRPSQVAALDRAVREAGWILYSSFEYGSPFGHAQTYRHESWGYLDLHRMFPGIRLDPPAAFELLWHDRHRIDVVGISCSVPSVEAQAAILVLNAARAGGGRSRDVRRAWEDADDATRERISHVVRRLRATVAFAAATGMLEEHRSAPDYALWKVITQGGSRSAEWWARVRAAPTPGAALAVIARAPRVNVERLSHRLGRAPTRREIRLEFVRRPLRAMRELAARVSRRRP